MNKIQLKNKLEQKRILELGLPIMYIVRSNDDSVLFDSKQVIDIKYQFGSEREGDERLWYHRFFMDGESIDLREDYNDNYNWGNDMKYEYFLIKSDAEKFFKKENTRINKLKNQ